MPVCPLDEPVDINVILGLSPAPVAAAKPPGDVVPPVAVPAAVPPAVPPVPPPAAAVSASGPLLPQTDPIKVEPVANAKDVKEQTAAVSVEPPATAGAVAPEKEEEDNNAKPQKTSIANVIKLLKSPVAVPATPSPAAAEPDAIASAKPKIGISKSRSMWKKLQQNVFRTEEESQLAAVVQNITANEANLDPDAVRVLRYWFKTSLDDCLELWFGKDEETDRYIDTNFRALVGRAHQGLLSEWIKTPLECLALVILLDQFPRNIFRFSPDMYQCDSMALSVVSRAIFYGYHTKISKIEAVFFCLVLTHSENINHQHLCMDVWANITSELKDEDPLKKFDDIFRKHVLVCVIVYDDITNSNVD